MAKKKETEGYKVTSEFRDRNNFNKIHAVGDDVSHLEDTILDSLLSRGLIEAPKDETKAKVASEKEAAKVQAELEAKADEDKKAKEVATTNPE
ncbi:hypothetical protein [Dyadobacter sp. LHD-138]|uniref:hypothetical protein n=1 Tax=Dyadobacter sp. LHD-138 TaxID=3071413 RepID=UPI0027E1844D|nr:hypothetical protein [Dyadobacter sp. LHD-138]MDQ6482226.1 hypothetical protein [Dyadobacter sp. LHD-138]